MTEEFEEKRIVGRCAELDGIRSFFSDKISKWRGGSLYVCGRSGTGKTEAVKQVFDGLKAKIASENASSTGNKSKRQKPESNVRLLWSMGTATTGSAFLSNLAKDFDIRVSKGPEQALEAAFMKKRENVLYIMVTDEIDLLPQDTVRKLFNWANENSCFALLGIANVVNAGSKLFKFDKHVPIELPFEPYKVPELKPIVEKKLGEKLARFDPRAIELCVRKTEKNSAGDVRACLNLCDRLLQITNDVDKLIGLSDVVKVAGPSETPQSKRIQALPAQARFALVACVLAHRKETAKLKQVKAIVAERTDENNNNAEHEEDSLNSGDKETFESWLSEKAVKEAWACLRENWKIPTDGNLHEHLDRLKENDVLLHQAKKSAGGKSSASGAKRKEDASSTFKIKPNAKDISLALLGDEEDSSNDAGATFDIEVANRRPIVMAFRGIRPRVLANMHAPLAN